MIFIIIIYLFFRLFVEEFSKKVAFVFVRKIIFEKKNSISKIFLEVIINQFPLKIVLIKKSTSIKLAK